MSSEPKEPDINTAVYKDVEEPIQPKAVSVFDSAPLSDPTSRLKPPVSSEDENVLKYFVMLRPTGPAATVLVKVCVSLYQGGQKSVKDYYLTELGLSNAQYRKAFTTHERQLLETNTKWDLFDITFLYKLLQRVCGLSAQADKWAQPQHDADELEHQLYLVKCERNFLAHETVTLTDQQLENRSKHLKSTLETILFKLGSRKNVDFSRDISLMKRQVDEVLNTMSKYSLQSYQKELEELRSSIVTKLIHEAQTELFPQYLNLWSSAQAWWFKVPGHDNEDNVPSEEDLFTDITIKDMKGDELQIKDFLLYKTSDGLCPQIKIIEGIAGIGKSHLCKYILFKWASQEEDITSLVRVDIIIFIQCYAITSKSLREFLTEELLQITCSTLRHDDVIPALQNCQVMFIIDGIDEAGPNAKAVIKEVSMKFPNNTVLITCRPEFTEMTKSLMSMQHKNVCTFFAKGFNGDQQWDYVKKIIAVLSTNDGKRTSSEFSQEINELQEHLSALLCMPLTIIMVVLLWINDNSPLSATTTVTRIHQQTIDMKIKQLAQRMQRKSGERRHISTIERVCRKWLSVLGKVAWETLTHNTQILDEESVSALMEEANTYDIDPIDALSTFLKCIVLEKMFGTEYNWAFFHKAFQEYLTALHLSNNHEILNSHITGLKSENQLPTQQPQSKVISPYHYPSTSSGLYRTCIEPKRCRAGVFSCKCIFMLCFRACCPPKTKKRTKASAKKSAKKITYGLEDRMSANSSAEEITYELEDLMRPKSSAESIADELEDRMSANSSAEEDLMCPSSAEGIADKLEDRKLETCQVKMPEEHYYRFEAQTRESPKFRRPPSPRYEIGEDGIIRIIYDDELEDRMSLKSEQDKFRHVLVNIHGLPELEGKNSGIDNDLVELVDDDESRCSNEMEESPTLKNTLQFLAAIEAAKDSMNNDYMKDIIMKFDRITLDQWDSWSTFLKECGEKPAVCQLMKEVLNNKTIDIHSSDLDGTKLQSIEYLLNKTHFQPSILNFRITQSKAFPRALNTLLCTVDRVSPTTKVDLRCTFHHCVDLMNTLVTIQTLQQCTITVFGTLEKKDKDSWIELLRCPTVHEVQLQVEAFIGTSEDLIFFSLCCMELTSLPANITLELQMNCIITDELIDFMCTVLDAYSWRSSLTFTFMDKYFRDNIEAFLELLTKALHQCSVSLQEIKMVVEAHAVNNLDQYKEMAYEISGEASCVVVLEDGADDDYISLILHGEKLKVS